MQRIILGVMLMLALSTPIFSEDRSLVVDSTVITEHQVTVRGERFTYTATAGTQPVWDQDGKVIASLFYTYYQRTNIQDIGKRPLVISFNGGPGSASVWMHIAYTGPRILNIDEEGYPVQPYGIKENPHSILDVADIVYVNPVNTGYSRSFKQEDASEDEASPFFGVEADIEYLAEWINTFVTRYNRWRSPKYLIGESYGTTRVAGLALALQEQQWMYLNGVILVSPTDLGIIRGRNVNAALQLPYFAATAWYHGQLPPAHQQKTLTELLIEVENYAVETVLPVLIKGAFADSTQTDQIATKMAEYSGLDKAVFTQHNLHVPTQYFWKELLREEGYTVGRLDSRYLGIDRADGGSQPDYNVELTTWLHEFTPAINYYLREHLNYRTDIKYNMFGPVRPWDNRNNTTGEDLRQAMAMNPYLQVLMQSGYFDGATQYFSAKYTLWQLDPSGKMRDRLQFEAYPSGHMMYLRADDLAQATTHLREFILNSIPEAGEAAQYRLK